MEGSAGTTGSRGKKKKRHEATQHNLHVKNEGIEGAGAHTPGPRKKKKRTNEEVAQHEVHVKSEAIGEGVGNISGPEKKKRKKHEAVQRNLHDRPTENNRSVNAIENGVDSRDLECRQPNVPEVFPTSEMVTRKKKRRHEAVQDNLHDSLPEKDRSVSGIENRADSTGLERLPSIVPKPVISPSKMVKKKKRHETVQHNLHDSLTEENRSASGIESGRDPTGLECTPSIVPKPVISPSEMVKKKKKKSHEAAQRDLHDSQAEENCSAGGVENEGDPRDLESTPSSGPDRVIPPSEVVKRKKKRKHEAVQHSLHEKNSSVNGSEDIADPTGLERSPQIVSEQVVSPSKTVKKKKKKKRDEAVQRNPHDRLTEENRPVNGTESGADFKGLINSSSRNGREPVISSSKMEKKRKKVRFLLPGEGDPELDPEDGPEKHNEEYDMSQLSEARSWRVESPQDFVYGKYSKAEDEKIRSSVINYIKMKGWDLEGGIERVLHPREHSEARGCWTVIAKCLPHRRVKQINSRATRIFKAHHRGKWSREELELLEELQRVYISDWKKIEVLLGRDRQLCKDKWRKLKFKANGRKGQWTKEEYDNLSKLVRKNLKIKASVPEDKKFDARKLRDNIDWEWIAHNLNRDSARCSASWYNRMASPMIAEQKWANGDDGLLLQRLMEMAPTSEDAVDWDKVLEHRDGEICRARWREMSKLLRENSQAPFEQRLEILARRYCPDLLGIVEDDVPPVGKADDEVPRADHPRIIEGEPHS